MAKEQSKKKHLWSDIYQKFDNHIILYYISRFLSVPLVAEIVRTNYRKVRWQAYGPLIQHQKEDGKPILNNLQTT